ncbi:MAG: hypothetical protein HXY44_15360 [Syntrophaceae bacterium]|nr:hypothetical protein [Syntrophaceae bacterium]
MDNENPKIEFFSDNGMLEIRYFDTPKDHLYRSWRLPESIVHELIAFRIGLKKNKEITFPLQKKTTLCEFTMHTEKFIEIKSLDSRGRTNMTGWSLPSVVVEQLINC